MQLNAISHKSSENMSYQLSKDELVISIKTGYDVDKVIIEHGDPFLYGIAGDLTQWHGTREEITEKYELDNHIWWTIKLKPEYKRLKYFFELHSKDESIYYLESGFATEEQYNIAGKRQELFYFPWMNEIDMCVTPQWVKDTIWYQIFPERFCNGDSSINPDNTREWKSEKIKSPHWQYGGDLQGIINKLEYLKDLGITGIYMTPVFESTSNHKYNTADYYKIDKHFGNNEVMKTLCDTAHKLGIKIMIDAVYNHSGQNFAPWEDVVKNGENSKYKDWFMVNKFPLTDAKTHTKDGRYYSFSFAAFMPKLNTNNKEVIDYLCEVSEYWVSDYGVDGIRFDVGNEVSHQFLKELRKRVKAVNKDVYLLGEIWHNSTQWLQGDEYDSVMNYPLTAAISEFWQDENVTSKDFEHNINRCRFMYQEQVTDTLFNMLDSHDTERLIHRANHEEDVFYQQLTLLYTMQGTPCVFYGTEIALEGGGDPDCRRCMPWDKIENGEYDEKINKLKKLIELRKTNKAFSSGKISFEHIYGDRVLSYIKTDEKGNKVKVILNAEDKEIELPEGEILFSNNVVGTKIQEFGTVILKI